MKSKPFYKSFRFKLLIVILIGYALPQQLIIPVKGASEKDWNTKSFWFYPWGKSGVHKGIDIFASEGTPVVSATHGIVLWTGVNGIGGNVVFVFTTKWRIHYYAHLQKIKTSPLSIAWRGKVIGTVGTTGNAKGKPPHLHYAILSAFPLFWQIDTAPQGWKKMFYWNPDKLLKNK